MNPEIEQMKRDIQELQNKLKQFESAGQLDPLYARTITQILSTNSSKGASSENVTVNEAGIATYSVMGTPTGFIRIGDNDVPYY